MIEKHIKDYDASEIKIIPEAIGIITEEMVKQMIKDIIYIIPYGHFKKCQEINFDSIESTVSIYLANVVKDNVDLWHSLFVLTELNEQENINKDFKENHYKLYYALGGDQMHRNYVSFIWLCRSVMMSLPHIFHK